MQSSNIIMVIYKTTNLINDKIYIGKDSKHNPEYLGSGKLLKQAIKKYGASNFNKTIIEKCSSTDTLNEREIFWISFYNSTDRNIGYNIACGGTGGDTISNHPNKAEISKNQSEWMLENNPTRGRKRSEQEIEKWKKSIGDKLTGKNHPSYGKHHSEKTKKIQSEIRKEWHKNLSDEDKQKISKKISEANTGKKSPLKGTTNKKHSDWMKINNPFKGKKHTPEARLIMSEVNKRPKTEEHRRKISESLMGNKPSNMVVTEIEGIVYESLTEASRETGIKLSTLRNRIKSNNPKFKNYKRYDKTK